MLQVQCVLRPTYSVIAREIGRPKAVRAAGSASGRNPVAYFIPCQRGVRSDGARGGYHWGVERKRMMLEWESSLQPQQPHQQAEMHFRERRDGCQVKKRSISDKAEMDSW